MDIFKAKIATHILIVTPFVLVSSILVSIGLGLSYEYFILMPIVSFVFVIVCAMFGLYSNLLFPNLDWSNETVPIKQGLASMLAMFVPWVFVIIVVAGNIFLSEIMSSVIYYILVLAICFGLIYLLYKLLSTKGKNIFINL